MNISKISPQDLQRALLKAFPRRDLYRDHRDDFASAAERICTVLKTSSPLKLVQTDLDSALTLLDQVPFPNVPEDDWVNKNAVEFVRQLDELKRAVLNLETAREGDDPANSTAIRDQLTSMGESMNAAWKALSESVSVTRKLRPQIPLPTAEVFRQLQVAVIKVRLNLDDDRLLAQARATGGLGEGRPDPITPNDP